MFYFPSLFRGNSFNVPATTGNKERNQSEEKTPPDTDYPEPLDPASLKKIAHMEDSKKLNLLKFKSIAGVITETLQKWTLNIEKLRGLGFDGASVMSGANTGVQARLREIQPRATYVHCRSHQLNLVLVNSCQKVPAVRNLMDSVDMVCDSFSKAKSNSQTMFEWW